MILRMIVRMPTLYVHYMLKSTTITNIPPMPTFVVIFNKFNVIINKLFRSAIVICFNILTVMFLIIIRLLA